MNVAHKYGFVRAIAWILKILAVIILIVGILALIVSFGAGPRFQLPQQLMVGSGAGALVLALVTFVQLYAFGSILSLLVKIEENTRAMLGAPEE
jgi:low affinity Fe/Cu permease